jgi:hypothetical protein
VKKSNCWEIKKCGKEIDGKSPENIDVCPAASDESSDGINGGENGGRICWAVAGTFCDCAIQGNLAQKIDSCILCEFFQKVKREEGSKNFILLKANQSSYNFRK